MNDFLIFWVVFSVLALIALRVMSIRNKTEKDHEVFLYHGDVPAIVGQQVNINGKIGKVIETSLLTITVEYD